MRRLGCRIMPKAVSLKVQSRTRAERSFVYALFLLLMFEPMSLFYLETESSVFEFIDTIWKMLSMCASAAVILLLWWRKTPSKWVYPIILLCIIRCISIAVNQGFGKVVSQAGTLLGFVALAWFLHDRMRYDKYRLLDGLLIMLSFYAICSLVSIVITQQEGLVPGTGTPVYFFGQKNMIFIYGMPLIAAMALRDYRKGTSISKATIAVAGLYSIVSLYIDSASSTFCFASIVAALIYLKLCSNPSRLFHPAVFIFLIAILFIITLIQQDSSGFIGGVLELLGRSPTFSGRTPAWEQAIQYFLDSPLIGQGENLVFTLAYGVEVSSAHSFYLASLAQYGIFYVAILIVDILLVSRIVTRQSSALVCVESVLYFILLIHSLYDIMYLSNYIIMRALVVYSTMLLDKGRVVTHTSAR